MNKRQVFIVSFLAAIPAAFLLLFAIWNAYAQGGNMSGVMGVMLFLTALLALLIAASPIFISTWYPDDGFGSNAEEEVAEEEVSGNSDDSDFETDGFDDEADDEFDDGEGSSDEEFEEFDDEDDEWN